MNEDQLITVGQVAHRVARLWPDVVAEDLRQELCLKWLESAKNSSDNGMVGVLDYWNDTDEKRGHNMLDRTLVRWAHSWCRKETAAVRGNDDYVRYDRYALTHMLPMLNKPEAWGSLAVTGARGRRAALASEGGDSLASYADLTRAWDMLTPEHQLLLEMRYVYELEEWQAEVMATFRCTPAAASKRVSRALDTLERNLAGKPLRDGPLDRRTVMSNAAAQSTLAHAYDG